MKSDIAKGWARALRGGEYEQGKSQLRNKDEFCCLGVLCDLFSQETGEKWENDGCMACSFALPDEVRTWAEIHSSRGVFGNGQHCLSSMNDRGDSFADIADTIEANVEAL